MASFTPHQQEALHYDKHISLTANAGSGKTMVLTRRFLDIVKNENISLRNIAAITFTKKAASELYNKIAKELDAELENAQGNAELRDKLEDLRKQLVSAHICTIHSFCADILREFPAEAGIDPGFVPLDEYMETELIAECAYTVFRDEAFTPIIKELSRTFNGTEALSRIVLHLIRSREQLITPLQNLYVSDDDSEVAKRLIERFTKSAETLHTDFFTEYQSLLHLFLRTGKDSGTKKGKESVTALLPRLAAAAVLENKSAQIAATTGIATEILTKTNKVLAAVIPTALQEDYQTEISKFLDLHKLFMAISTGLTVEGNIITEPFALSASYTVKIMQVFKEVLKIFTAKKLQRSALDFTDMLLKMRDLMEDQNVRLSLAGRFKYIMVDEYQDTNELQYKIFMPLLDDLRNGNLFVVGDDKQSIYMFRNAEIEIFAKTTNDILAASGEGSELKLPDTFRMAPGLCLFINKIFERLFAAPVAMFNEVQHVETVCARQSDAPGELGLLIGKNLEEEVVREEKLVIAKILELKQRIPDLRWGDIAILSRKKSPFETYRIKLPKYNIPFIINGGRGFFQSQGVFDVMNYLRFLVSPENDAPLIGILRSPFFMLSDAELLSMRFEGTGSLYNRLHYFCNQHPENARVKHAVTVLQKHVRKSAASSISDTVQMIFEDTGYLALMAARKDALQQLANLEKLKSMARTFEQEGFRTLYDFADYLYTSGLEKDDESFAQVADANDAVQIMSIHASKGLQFKVVFLIRAADNLSKKGFSDSVVSINKEFGLLFKLPDNNDFFKERINPPHKVFAEYIQHRKNMAEEKRLLYVALTRAEEYLFVAGTLTKDEVTPNSFLGMMADTVKPSFSNGTFEISGIINRLRAVNNTFEEHAAPMNFTVTNTAELDAVVLPEVKSESVEYHVDMQPLQLTALRNTISASQFAVFHSCPMKYFLRYRMRYPDGIGVLQSDDVNIYPEDDETDAADAVAEETSTENISVQIDAGLRGQILHKLLEMQAPIDETLSAAVAFAISKLPQFAELGTDIHTTEIENTYRAFVNSIPYQQLLPHTNFKSEYVILRREKEFRLHGIIDRLIFHETTATIIDYKSTAHPEKLDPAMLENYRRQLLFYAYLVLKMYPQYQSVSASILFISSPGKRIDFQFTNSDADALGVELQAMHSVILGEQFNKNTKHCPQCRYSIQRFRCVVADD